MHDFVSYFFHSSCFWDSSMLFHVSVICFFLLLSNISVNISYSVMLKSIGLFCSLNGAFIFLTPCIDHLKKTGSLMFQILTHLFYIMHMFQILTVHYMILKNLIHYHHQSHQNFITGNKCQFFSLSHSFKSVSRKNLPKTQVWVTVIC